MASDGRARIVIVGGGFGGLFTALNLAGAGEVVMVSAEDHFVFRPMLYEYMSGEVEAWHIAPFYKELLDERVQFVNAEATGVDFGARNVELNYDGRAADIEYDFLILAAGSVTNYWGIEGAAEHTMPFRTIADADALRRRMVEALDRIPPDAAPQDAQRAATFVVVGGGASGVELATKMADLLRDAFERRGLRGEPRVLLVEMAKRVVPGMDEDIREAVEEALQEKRVEMHTETRVVRVTPRAVVLEHGGEQTEVEEAAVVWVAGVRPSPLIEKLDAPKDRRGLLVVEPTLQVRGLTEVFALGDNASFPDVVPSLFGTAQLAFQQSDLCADNVQALLDGGVPGRKHFEELGEAVSLGTETAAVLAAGRVQTGALARQARFALYTTRLPTWQHRLRVGASWFFGSRAARPLVD
ncbi:MAG TPA: NAD(P)/FAD-dependent oxidoreductase [Pyrinomonadaceae bacterium]|nr:NAD(P)/FAD-dependent oxidoreductase [Pyrinomonadaceae bacterium]